MKAEFEEITEKLKEKIPAAVVKDLEAKRFHKTAQFGEAGLDTRINKFLSFSKFDKHEVFGQAFKEGVAKFKKEHPKKA